MATPFLLDSLRNAAVLILLLSAPVILAALLSSLLAGLLKGAVRGRDAAIQSIPRLVSGYLAVLILGGWIAAHVLQFARDLWLQLGPLGR